LEEVLHILASQDVTTFEFNKSGLLKQINHILTSGKRANEEYGANSELWETEQAQTYLLNLQTF
jgi:hypothetical protein